jgi:asparagine synthase (glutamine-hydrolysing)
MCGVAGYVNLNGEPASPVVLQAMTDIIAHRGPDGEGHWVEGAVAIGHRRLSIIDLSDAGHQPMLSADGRYVLSYNGEVYNFRELRLELEARGHQFRSRTDSEVVLNAWVEWGSDSLLRLNGMFAFAIWDREKRKLVLARDRFGIKPMYYARAGNAFLFGSEIKALLAHPKLSASVDPAGMAEYFTFQNFFSNRTLFAGVTLLPQGSYLQMTPGATAEPSIARYWDYDFREPETPLAQDDYLGELDRLFRQAVNRQLVSDVEIGSYLSGGMDSGSITAIAAQQFPNLKTFTVGFDLSSISGMEIGFDERRNAEHMSYLFRTEHYEMVLKAGDMERCMQRLVWHMEEPRVGQCYPNYYAARLASRFGKVVLSGAGGDELFGGYPWRYYRAVVNDNFEHYIDKYYLYWHRLIPNTVLHRVFQPIHNQIADVWTRDIFRDVFATHAAELTRPEDYVNHSLYFEAKTFLHGLLVVEDKLSMAHSLETRLPFLDNDLVDFAQRTPVGLKLGNLGEVVRLNENEPGPKTRRYFERTRDGKLLLRSVMNRHVPIEVTQREKQGFSAPDASWFRGESIDYVRDRLLDPAAGIYDFMDRAAVGELIDDHLQGRQNRRLLIWSLLYVEEWLSVFMAEQRTARRPYRGVQPLTAAAGQDR